MTRRPNEISGLLFLVGMPRSGTKLLRDLINQSNSIYMPPVEAKWIPTIVELFGDGAAIMKQKQISHINCIIQQSAYAQNMKELRLGVPLIPNNLAGITLLEVVRWFLHSSMGKNENVDNVIVGDKTPVNIFKLDFLKRLDPNALVLHIVRDPRDQSRSVAKTWGKSPIRNASRWSHGVGLAEKWGANNPSQYFRIRYEDLISDTRRTMLSVCDFLQIPFTEDVVKLKKPSENLGDAKGETAIVHSNTGKWREYFSKKEIKKIEELTAPTARLVGYKMKTANQRQLGTVEEMWYTLLDGFHMLKFYSGEYGLLGGLLYFVKTLRD